ncbi:T9SS type A sorting domain-containing protein [Aureisphaera sp. CAU 1614]|uniref:T9SS type A sorting domain-containing protein n=1 Tax=Halomarinibacterium sedimenti TaxID=2857106 RepID=A0A9X1FMV1_9FLAO|nr:T9SS type A sorting domain-containing protein [Halomarinibacterium sedimenti]MBW2937133.1 T9SS type A sorting domain-containing protein [Halomarinibacterium sedimenti]
MKKIFVIFLLIHFNFAGAQIIDVITGITHPNEFELSGDDLYFVEYTDGIISKIDVNDPNPQPEFIYDVGNNLYDILIYQNRLFYTVYNNPIIYEIDLNDPNPTPTQFMTGLNHPDGLLLIGTELYISERWGDKISKVNINDSNPTIELVVTVQDPRELWLDGDILYIMAQDGSKVMSINITDIDPTTELVTNTGGIASDIIVYENDIYISYIFEDKISKYDQTNGLVTQIEGINGPIGMIVIGEDLYFTQYDANKISKIDINSLPISLSVSENDFENISIYPNPVSTDLTINGLDKSVTAEIYDLEGRLIKISIINPLDKLSVDDLNSGFYLLKIDDYKVVKFIKK